MNALFVMFFLFCFAVSASFMLLAFFSLQVYTVMKFPFKAPHFWTRKRVALYCVGIWLLAGLLALNKILILLDLHFDKSMKWWAIQNAVYGIIVIIQIALKILTCWEIFKTRRNSRPSQSSKHRQVTTTVMIMVAVQMLTGFPYVVILQLGHGVISVNYHLLMEIRTYYSPLVFLNFCVNPIIYFLRLPDYKSSLHSLCECRKRKNQTFSDNQRNKQGELPLLYVPPTTSRLPS